MTKLYSGFPHLNGHLLCAVDLETTGTKPGYHEIVQIAIVPLNSDIEPMDVRPFYINLQPLFPQRSESQAMSANGLSLDNLCKHGVHPDRVIDLLIDYVEGLDLPYQRKITPLAHNWPFEHSFLTAWLGTSLRDAMFHYHARDAMTYALSLNDRAFRRAEAAPFSSVGLSSLCNHFGIKNENPHDALNDCLAEAEVYKNLLTMPVL